MQLKQLSLDKRKLIIFVRKIPFLSLSPLIIIMETQLTFADDTASDKYYVHVVVCVCAGTFLGSPDQ